MVSGAYWVKYHTPRDSATAEEFRQPGMQKRYRKLQPEKNQLQEVTEREITGVAAIANTCHFVSNISTNTVTITTAITSNTNTTTISQRSQHTEVQCAS